MGKEEGMKISYRFLSLLLLLLLRERERRYKLYIKHRMTFNLIYVLYVGRTVY